MNDKMTEVLEQIAIKLGVTADHLWGVLIAQQRIDAGIHIAFSCLSVINLLAFIAMFRWAIRTDTIDHDLWGPMLLVWGTLTVVFCIAFFVCVCAAITEIANPEYAALKGLLNMMGG